jgi:hypothetical protein
VAETLEGLAALYRVTARTEPARALEKRIIAIRANNH